MIFPDHVSFALAHPVFDPDRDVTLKHYWNMDRRVVAGLTVNLGLE